MAAGRIAPNSTSWLHHPLDGRLHKGPQPGRSLNRSCKNGKKRAAFLLTFRFFTPKGLYLKAQRWYSNAGFAKASSGYPEGVKSPSNHTLIQPLRGRTFRGVDRPRV